MRLTKDRQLLYYEKYFLLIAPMPETRRARRIVNALGVLAVSGVLGVAALLGALWLEHKIEITLPAPAGPFAVGRAVYAWTDNAHSDPLAPAAGTKHELLVWIWYPAAPPQPSQTPAEYLPAPWRDALERQVSVLFTQFLTRDSSRVRTHSIRDAAVSPQQQSYPVVFMRAGLAALTADYTTLAEDLAS